MPASPFAEMDDLFNNSSMFGGRPPSPPNGSQQQRPASMFDIFDGLFSGFPMASRRQAPQTTGCSEEFIKNLPKKDSGKDSDCYICLDKCKDGEESCQLPCGHAFDKACIEQWIKSNDSCPVCRTKLDQNRPQREQP